MTDYIKNMRMIVGHIPILQCGASVIVENQKGEILLQQRKDNNCWAYSGGSIELDEVVEEAAARELQEETGLIAHNLELFGVFSGIEMHYVYPNGDEVSNIDIVYICNNYSGELKVNPDEVIDLRFFSIDSIPDNISPPNIKVIKKYLESRSK
jgi:mutator protein MutT